MNRSIKSLILAAGVAVATTTIAVPAHADGIPSGPGNLGTVQPGPVVDPKPQPQPVPAGPSDIANPPQCTHGCGDDQGPAGPKDVAPAPAPADEEVTNGGPLIAQDPEDDPANNAPLDQGCFDGCDLPDAPVDETVDEAATTESEASPVVLDSAKPSVAEELDAAEVAPVLDEDGDTNLLWWALGGGGLGALLLVAAAWRRRQQEADAA